MKHQRGQTTVFFALILAGLLLLTAVGIEIERIVYVRGEVAKAADAAAWLLHRGLTLPYTGRSERLLSYRTWLPRRKITPR